MRNFPKLSHMLLSVSVPALTLSVAASANAQNVTISGANTNTEVNTQINANTESDLILTFAADAVVTGGQVNVSPLMDANNEAITIINNGDIGSVDAMGAITDLSGLQIFGSGDAADTDSQLTLTNSGLVTDSILAGSAFFGGFNGGVDITNTGDVFGGISAVNNTGDITIDTSGGAVNSGNVSAFSSGLSLFDSKTGVTTFSPSGDVLISAGDVASADGKILGNITANSNNGGDVSVTVSGVAGAVTATSGGSSDVSFQSNPAMAGMTVTTVQNNSAPADGDVSLEVTKTGNVERIQANNFGAGTTTITVDGTVSNETFGNSISTNGFSPTENTFVQTQTQDADGNTTQTATNSSNTLVGGGVDLAVGEDGVVDTKFGNINLFNSGGAAADIGGTVTAATLTLRSSGIDNTSAQTNTFDSKTGNQLTQNENNTNELAGGAASLMVQEDATLILSNNIIVDGDESATVTVGGDVETSGIQIESIGDSSSTQGDVTFDSKTGALLTSETETTRSLEGGAAALIVEAGGSIDTSGGTINLDGDESVSVINQEGGVIKARLDLDADRFITESTTSSETRNSDGDLLSLQTENTFGTDGGTASLVNAQNAVIESTGFHSIRGTQGVDIDNAGEISGFISASSFGSVNTAEDNFTTNEVMEVLDSKAMTSQTTVTTTDNNSSEFMNIGGTTDFSNVEGGVIENGGSFFGNSGVMAVNAGEVNGGLTFNSTGSMSSNSNEESSVVTTEVLDSETAMALGQTSLVTEETRTENNSSQTATTGGSAIITNEDSGDIDSVSSFVNSDVELTNSGNINGFVNLSASGTETVNRDSADGVSTNSTMREVLDSKNGLLLTTDTETFENTESVSNSGGSVSVVNNSGGLIDGNSFITANTNTSFSNMGAVQGFVTLNSAGSMLTETSQSEQVTITNEMTAIDSVNSAASSMTVQSNTGGSASFTNAQGGLIEQGNVSITAQDGITIDNAGVLIGSVNAVTNGISQTETSENTSSQTVDASMVDQMTGEGATVTTMISQETDTSETTVLRSDITGEYSGVNGALNFVGANGSITQNSSGNSTANVSGSVFGDVSSSAGIGSDLSVNSSETDEFVLDSEGNGSNSATQMSVSTQSVVSESNSLVTVSGTVQSGTSGLSGDVSSFATNDSLVSIDGGDVAGNVNSFSGDIEIVIEASFPFTTLEQTVTEFNTVTDAQTQLNSNMTVSGGGDANISLSNAAVVGGALNASSAAGSTVSVDTTSLVDGSVFAQTQFNNDTETSTANEFMRDAETGNVSATQEIVNNTATNLTSGDASVSIAGIVGGNTNAVSGRGNADVNITGTSGSVFAQTAGTQSLSTTTRTFEGNVEDDDASGSNNFNALISQPGVFESRDETVSSFTNLGGTANVTIDTDPSLQAMGEIGVEGDITVEGLAGATAQILNGSIVNGRVEAESDFVNSESTTVETISAAAIRDVTIETSQTNVGTTASILNDGVILGGAESEGTTSATLTNNGVIGSIDTVEGLFSRNQPFFLFAPADVSVTALEQDSVSSIADLNTTNAALRDRVETTTNIAVGGDALVDNSGVIAGSVEIQGASGVINNDGLILGTIVAGQSVDNFTTVTQTTATTSSMVTTLPTDLFEQNYTINQNNISAGVTIGGATVNIDDEDVVTSDINATINLNSGSLTLGDIRAQQDATTGENLTNTTLNLNGSGFLGLDSLSLAGADNGGAAQAIPTFSPGANVLSVVDAATLFGDSASDEVEDAFVPVRALGLTEINKDGAGTFVITGAPLIPSSGPGDLPTYTLDADNININAGEVQLTLSQSAAGGVDEDLLDGLLGVVGADDTPSLVINTPQFGISGDINNDATLVLGRRVNSGIAPVGQSLVQGAPQLIAGVNVVQDGNFNQSGTGSLVVGLEASLSRFGDQTILPVGIGTDLLSPIAAPTLRPFFTAPSAAGLGASSSNLQIDGDLDLAGTIEVVVVEDSLFLSGDNAQIISYTGTGNVTATASPSLASNFVDFNVVHDVAEQTVSIETTRNSFSTVASNPNAAAAATGFDGELVSAVADIRSDAFGNDVFTSVEDINLAQDVANIASALDFNLSSSQAATVFDELSGGEIHSSISAIDQSVISDLGHETAKLAIFSGEDISNSVYINPFNRDTQIGGGDGAGASDIDVNTLAAGFGVNLAYSDNGVFGFAVGYGEHEIDADGTQEIAELETFTGGVYGTHKFNQFYGSADVAFSFSNVDTERTLDLLSRTITAEYDATQFDGAFEVGYIFDVNNFILTPYGRVEFRNWNTDGFTEQGGGAVALEVDDASSTVISPIVGGKVATKFNFGSVLVQPYADLSYSFQGDVDAERQVDFIANGANPFTLQGVDPDGFGAIDGGFIATIGSAFNIFANIQHDFSGDYSQTSIRGGAGFRF